MNMNAEMNVSNDALIALFVQRIQAGELDISSVFGNDIGNAVNHCVEQMKAEREKLFNEMIKPLDEKIKSQSGYVKKLTGSSTLRVYDYYLIDDKKVLKTGNWRKSNNVKKYLEPAKGDKAIEEQMLAKVFVKVKDRN